MFSRRIERILTKESHQSQNSSNFQIQSLTDAFILPTWLPHSAWHEHIPFAMYITAKAKPRLFVELGSYFGLSYCAFCEAALTIGFDTQFFAIDTWQGDDHTGLYDEEAYRTLSAYHEQRYSRFSTLLRSKFEDSLKSFKDGSIDMLHIDGYHAYDQVKTDFDNWLIKMSNRGIVLLHDINVRHRDFGVWKLWDELIERYPAIHFDHGHGLGILFVGTTFPNDDVKLLFTAVAEDKTALREFFSYTGKRWLIEYKQRQATETLLSRNRTIEQLQQASNDHDATIRRLKKSLAKRNTRIAQSQAVLAERDATIEHQRELIRELLDLNKQHFADLQSLLHDTRNSHDVLHHRIDQVQRNTTSNLGRQIDNLKKHVSELGHHSSHLRRTIIDVERMRKLSKKEQIKQFIIQAIGTRAMMFMRSARHIRKSGLFDPEWYVRQYPEVAQQEIDPLWHYLWYGVSQNLNPSPLFDSAWYIHHNPEVSERGINPLIHFLSQGELTGAAPSKPFVDAAHPSKYRDHQYLEISRKVQEVTKPVQRIALKQDVFDTKSSEAFIKRMHSEGFVDWAMRRQELVSIVLPTRNRITLVLTAINSVLNQTYRNWELVIVDDGSHDQTLERLQSTYDDVRIKILCTDGVGVSGARNKALQSAMGEFIAYLDSDNEWQPDYLLFMLAAFEASAADMMYAANESRRNDGTIYYRASEFHSEYLAYNNFIDLNTLMHRRWLYDQHGGFDEDILRMVDWDLILKYSRVAKVSYVPFIGALYDDSDRSDRISLDENLANFQYVVQNKHLIDWEQLDTRIDDRDPNLASIIIPIHNQLPLTEGCLQSLLTHDAGFPFEVILVNNGSNQRVAERLSLWDQIHSRIHVVHNFANLNFALGCNIGVANSTGKYIVLLNNDTTATRNWLMSLVSSIINDSHIGVVAPKLLYPNKTLQGGGLAFNSKSKIPYHIYRGLDASHPAINKPRYYQAVTGACVAMRAEDFIRLRGFDCLYVNGGEDIDLCFRIRHELGKKVYYNPASEIYHHEGKTEGRLNHAMDNRRRVVSKWASSIYPDDQDIFFEDGFEVVEYEKPGTEPDGETAIYQPIIRESMHVAVVDRSSELLNYVADDPVLHINSAQNSESITKVVNVGISTMWYVRGVALLSRQLALAIESPDVRTHIFARWESENFQNSGAVSHPRVYNAGDDPSPSEIVEWAMMNNIELMIFMEVHPNDWKRVQALQNCGIKVMCYDHLDILRLKDWDHYHTFDYFLFTSFHTREVILDKIPNTPSITIPWGIQPPEWIEPGRAAAGRPLQFVHIAGWGGVNNRKNTDLLIRAFDRSCPINAELHVYIQSSISGYGTEIENIISANSAIIIHEGTIENIFEAYHHRDMLLAPTKREGLGLPIVEALACGLPVLVTDGYLMKQWIVPGKHGVLCPARPIQGDRYLPEMEVDEAALVQIIKQLAEDRDLVRRMSDVVSADREIWLWNWQADVLRVQIRNIIEIAGYEPPEDLSYLPAHILQFEKARKTLDH